MFNFTTGMTALRANQVALDVIAQNIANANTEGYHRQVVRLVDRPPIEQMRHLIGTGVDVTRIDRIRHAFTEQALQNNVSDLADTASRRNTLVQIESLLTPGPGSLFDRLQTFFDTFEQLSTRPDDPASRSIALQTAVSLTRNLNSLTTDLAGLAAELEAEIVQAVEQVNTVAAEISALNREIRVAEARGLAPNDLWDRRDQLLGQLAELTDVHTAPRNDGDTSVFFAEGMALIGHEPPQLEVLTDSAGNVIVTRAGSEQPLTFGSGKLAGLLVARNQVLSRQQAELSTFARGLMQAVDGVHATGMGLSGTFQILRGQRGVQDVSSPLAEAGAAFPMQAGRLFLSVTDQASGARTLEVVSIDPATDSLEDVAAAISAVAHLQATVDARTGSLTILAEPGYGFDFAGRLPTLLDTPGVTGTTTPRLHGAFSGADNDQFVFEFTGNGTVGVTPGLTLEVRNGAGDLIASLDVGEGYEPESPLAITDGVSLGLSSSTANTGDTFSSHVVAHADTAGVLTALGLNTFFAGSDTGDIRVNPAILEDPDLFATSRSGQPGADTQMLRLLGLRDARVIADSNQTLVERLAETIAMVGGEVRELDLVHGNLEALGQHLHVQRQSISGVDPNEELVKMLQFQRSFQAAAQHITTINETLDDLFRIVR